MELRPIERNGNDGTIDLSNTVHHHLSSNTGVTTTGNGNGGANGNHEATETNVLLTIPPSASNGETDHETENESALTPIEVSRLRRIKKELNEVVYWKIRLWMIIVFIVLLIVAVGLITPLICSATYVDPDDTYDRSSFNTRLCFRGSFILPNLVFTEELLNTSSIQSQAFSADVQEKLSDLFRSSPALGRYFSKVELQALRDGSVIADYLLTFLMPEVEQDQLRNFTLSQEVVFNVFRQFLYDQELDESEPMFIDPVSLNMTATQ